MDFHALQPDYELEGYRIINLIGEGGFGLTYLALDVHLDKKVAIKEFMPSEYAIRQEGVTVIPKSDSNVDVYQWGLNAFLEEAKTLAKFDNINIVRIHRFFKANGTAYIVMEYCEGGCLVDEIKKGIIYSEQKVKKLLTPLIEGLQIVHQGGVLHRDIKPENIMFRKNGTPVLIDFGAARLALGVKTRSITTIVTPGFAPIEQYSTSAKIGPWSDIYSLAAVAYVCLTGNRPVDAMDRLENDSVEKLSSQPNSSRFLKSIDQGFSVHSQQRPNSLAEWRQSWESANSPIVSNSKTIRPEQEEPNKLFKTVLLTVAALLIIGFGVFQLYKHFNQVGSTEPPATSMESVKSNSEKQMTSELVKDERADVVGEKEGQVQVGVKTIDGNEPETRHKNKRMANETLKTGVQKKSIAVETMVEQEHNATTLPNEQIDNKIDSKPHENDNTEQQVEQTVLVDKQLEDCQYCPKMKIIPAGHFDMGGDSGDDNELPRRNVIISSFSLSTTEVTFEQWDECYAQKGCDHYPEDHGWGRAKHPVVDVTWHDAKQYVAWLSQVTDRKYRLPTEAEWEYASKAGGSSQYHWGDGISCDRARYGYYSNECGKKNSTDEVASFTANQFGIYDMHGNVYEWVEDCYFDNYQGAPNNNQARTKDSCKDHVTRGGSWSDEPFSIRSEFRKKFPSHQKEDDTGFRVAKDITSHN